MRKMEKENKKKSLEKGFKALLIRIIAIVVILVTLTILLPRLLSGRESLQNLLPILFGVFVLGIFLFLWGYVYKTIKKSEGDKYK